MRLPRVIALDLGAERVGWGLFSKGATGRLVLERGGFETLRADTGSDERWTNEITRALGILVAREKLRGPAVVALPGHVARTRYIATPAVEKEKRGKVLAFEAAENFPHPLNELAWDSVVLLDDGLDLRAILAAAKLEPVRAICAIAEQSGLKLEGVAPAAFTLLHGFRYNYPEVRESTAVANIGARSTQVMLIEGERFGFRTFPLGGAFVTQAIADELRVEVGRAESLKRQILRARADAPLEAAIQEAVRRASESFAAKLQHELARTVLHLRRQLHSSAPVAMFLTGGGARLPELAVALAQKLGVPAKRYDPLRNVDVAADARAAGVDELADHLSDLVGLGTRLVSGVAPRINLLPAPVTAAAVVRRRRPRILAAAAVLALGLAVPIYGYHRRAEANRREIARLETEVRPLRLLTARMAENRQELERTRQEIASLKLAYDTRTGWLNFLRDLQTRLVQVEDVWLDKLEVVRIADVPAAVEPSDSNASENIPSALRLMLSGRLLDVANPQSRVSRESEQRVKKMLESFTGSPFVAAVENERFDNRQHGLLRFDCTLVLNPRNPL